MSAVLANTIIGHQLADLDVADRPHVAYLQRDGASAGAIW